MRGIERRQKGRMLVLCVAVVYVDGICVSFFTAIAGANVPATRTMCANDELIMAVDIIHDRRAFRRMTMAFVDRFFSPLFTALSAAMCSGVLYLAAPSDG